VFAAAGVIVPHAAPLQLLPETLHVMPVAGFELGAGVSAAVYVADDPTSTAAGPLMLNVKWLVTVIAAAADLLESAILWATSDRVGGAGKDCGAV
jgi:hypothetical protein